MAQTTKYNVQDAELLPSFKIWRAGAYLRLSQEDGDIEEGDKYESDSISNQKLIIDDHLTENEVDDVLVVETFTDDGYTGANFDRPDFQRMIEWVRLAKINCVIVKDNARFARNAAGIGDYVEVFFREMDVRFISVLDFVDSHLDPRSVNNIGFSMKNVVNEEYCRETSIKVRGTLDNRREEGEYIGNHGPYGYALNSNDRYKLVVDTEPATIIRLMFKTFLEGKSVRGVAKLLNSMGVPNPTAYKKAKGLKANHRGINRDTLWTVGTVRYILTNRILIGDMVQGRGEKISYKSKKKRVVKQEKWFIKEGTHEPIIDATTFWNVQDLLSRGKRVSPKTQTFGLFSGFLHCADCKRTLGKNLVSNPNLNYHYYVCRTHENMSKTACPRHSIRSDRLEKAVFITISQHIATAVEMNGFIAQINKSVAKKVATSRTQLALDTRDKERVRLERILYDLYPDWKGGLISREQYIMLKAKHEAELEKTKKAIEELRKDFERDREGVDGSNRFIQIFSEYTGLTTLTREVLIALVDRIEVHVDNKIDIAFKFQDAYQRAADYVEVNRGLLEVAI